MKINIIKNHSEIDEMHKLIWEECKEEIIDYNNEDTPDTFKKSEISY